MTCSVFFQNKALYQHLSLKENCVPLRASPVESKEGKSSVLSCLGPSDWFYIKYMHTLHCNTVVTVSDTDLLKYIKSKLYTKHRRKLNYFQKLKLNLLNLKWIKYNYTICFKSVIYIICCSVSVGNISLHFQTFILPLIIIIQWDICLTVLGTCVKMLYNENAVMP